MLRVKPKTKIVERKLGREGAMGQWWEESNLIEIDPRHENSKSYLDTCVHELLHSAAPQLTESQVKKIACIITKGLWGQKFRRIMQ